MANAQKAISKTVTEEGGFQNDSKDTGNFHGGINYGTKYGITPGAWLAFYKPKALQTDTIKNLTVTEAVPIYKKNYWDKFRGDEIENDSLAELMMFTVVNSGAGQVVTFKQLINTIAGEKVVAETPTPLTSAEIDILNSLDAETYFNALKGVRERFYKRLVEKDPVKQKYLKGWLNRLNKYQFSGSKKKALTFSAALVLLILVALWFFFLRR